MKGVAPSAQLARRQQRDRFVGQRAGYVNTNPLDITDFAAASFQIGFVGVERLRNGDRLGCPTAIRASERTLSCACQKVSTSLPSASAKSSAAPIVRTQLPHLPSATRIPHTPPLLLRRYPSPSPFATRTNVGLIATGRLSRAERVSRVDERIDRVILCLVFVLPT